MITPLETIKNKNMLENVLREQNLRNEKVTERMCFLKK